MLKFKSIAAVTAALGCAATVQAGPLLDAAAYAGLAGNPVAVVDGVAFTATGGAFDTKFVNGWGGIGVTAGASGARSMSASRIAMAFAPRVISDFSVALLYNGQVLIGSYTHETGGDNTVPGAAWSGPGSVTNLSLPIESAGGAWRVSGNPFGDGVPTSLVFSALASGDCQSQCSNQSDYVLSSVYAVPEPGSCALALPGFGAAAFTPRRRRPPN